jgi:hypothetical protein
VAAVTITCGCGQWKGHPDAQSCRELRECGSTPIIRAGDVLDGVIVVEDSVADAGSYGDAPSPFDCDCSCHEDAD